jgi:hypothetical protein
MELGRDSIAVPPFSLGNACAPYGLTRHNRRVHRSDAPRIVYRVSAFVAAGNKG